MSRHWLTAIAVALVFAACGKVRPPDAEPVNGVVTPTATYVLPNHDRTPGAADPAITQNNIATTICHGGYSTQVRPPESFTRHLRQQQIASYWPGAKLTDYVEDHLMPLSIGGAPRDDKNLWPEPKASSRVKDGLENYLLFRVCRAHVRLSLLVAQQAIASNWVAAWHTYGEPKYVNHTPYFVGGKLT